MNIPRYISNLEDISEVIITDSIVIGGGIAGLYTALQLCADQQVYLISKKSLTDSNTRWAQGGIAAVISELDSPELHKQDTLMAGAGLCDENTVDILVHEGPAGVHNLIEYGILFDEENGEIALTKEGAHSQRRILHARGDATGEEIVRGLSEKVMKQANIHVLENHFSVDILTQDNRCYGVIVFSPQQKKILIQAKSVILATGGTGQLYKYTTNPDIATGDGIALAYRAGAEIQDMEFIQFHPTALFYPGAPRFLISEAVRGEGAILRNTAGVRFMEKYHPLVELAPRDVVARAIVEEIEKSGSQHVYLDFTHETEEKIKHRFPTIYQRCLEYGLNIIHDWIPVAPAAHYTMGGVKTGEYGQTNIVGLYACGEVACTGIHGANRLASNSLSEAIVFGKRIAEHITKHREGVGINDQLLSESLLREQKNQVRTERRLSQPIIEKRIKLQKMMVKYAGLKRDEASLKLMQKELEKFFEQCKDINWDKREEWEYINLLTCSFFVVLSALLRKESRGGHFRIDYPYTDDQAWLKHIVLWRDKKTAAIKEGFRDVKSSQVEKSD